MGSDPFPWGDSQYDFQDRSAAARDEGRLPRWDRSCDHDPVDLDLRQEVIKAAEARAAALADADAERLSRLLHENFRWTSHVGETYSREEYIRRNTGGPTAWRSQHLTDPDVVVVGRTAVLFTEVIDVIDAAAGGSETFRMPMTQVWVREGGAWTCLAGHAGPRRSQA